MASSYVVDLSGNAIFALPPNLTGGGLRPYLTAGLGLMHAEGVDILTFLRIRRTMPAITLGAGATGLLTNRVGVRFDVRYLRSIAQQDEFQISVGRQRAIGAARSELRSVTESVSRGKQKNKRPGNSRAVAVLEDANRRLEEE